MADKGFGIPEKNKDKIFTKLFRADNARSMQVEGNGLGLYIVKAIVENAEGTISFTSKEGEGTTFVVTLPASGMKSRKSIRKLDSIMI